MSATVLLCAPASTPAKAPGSTLATCIECRGEVWVSPASLLLAREARAFFVCLPCAPTLADDGVELQVAPLTPEQVAEAAAARDSTT